MSDTYPALLSKQMSCFNFSQTTHHNSASKLLILRFWLWMKMLSTQPAPGRSPNIIEIFLLFEKSWPARERVIQIRQCILETRCHRVRQLKILLSSCFPMSNTKQAEGPEQMVDCSELMHQRDCLQSTRCNCWACVEMVCSQQHNRKNS